MKQDIEDFLDSVKIPSDKEVEEAGMRFDNRIEHMRRKRRAMWLSGSVAVVAFALFFGIRSFTAPTTEQHNITIARTDNDVMLTLPDGAEITLNRLAEDSLIATEGNVFFALNNGTLVQKKQSNREQTDNDMKWATVEVPKGLRFDLALEDGTRVWLNAGSRFRFPVDFSGSERRVHLEGEGYFEVERDTKRPFLVETSAQVLRVLGTKFNVCAYNGDATTYTTLVEGSVSVRSMITNAETTLMPNQQAALCAVHGEFTLKTVDPMETISWRSGHFVFEGNTLEQIMQKLARWYDFDYSFEDDEIKFLISKGSIPEQNDLRAILDIIEATGPVKLEINGKHVKVSAE